MIKYPYLEHLIVICCVAICLTFEEGISGFIEYYNHRRHHQGIDGKVPWELFLAAA